MSNLKPIKMLLLSGACFLCLPGIAPVFAATDNSDPEILVKDGKFFGQARYRYEFVDQDGITNNAKASTIRANFGFQTGTYNGFRGLIEGQLVQNIGANDFNDTVNGNGTYPVVADPDVTELNQAWVAWAGLQGVEIKAGRQGINLDNQRFTGTVGWRQNDQTFDSALVTYTGIDRATLQYGHIWNVNRIFGDDHSLGDLNTQSHIVRAGYHWADWLDTVAYGYWLDFDRLSVRSSQTYGIRATGKLAPGDHWTFAYEAEAATQDDYQNNTAGYDEEYYHLSSSLSGHGLTVRAGYEVLGGDGTNAFQTPLATLHKFNGWADKFLSTPGAGLEDLYGQVSYEFSGVNDWIDGTKITVLYHDFEGEESGDFGSELDLAVGKSFKLPERQPFDKLNVLIKYADYDAEDLPYRDTQKTWLQISVNF